MLCLRNVRDEVFVETMQNINAILPNGRSVVPFCALVFLSLVSTWLIFADDHFATAWWCVAAAAFSVITLWITAAKNVPMNNALDDVGTPESPDTARTAREANERPWALWNDPRTSTSAIAFVALVEALATLP